MPESVVNNGADWSANVQLKSSKKSSCLSTIAIYGFYITVPIIIILLWTLLWMIAQQHATQERASLCLTPECIQISSTILERIDQSINPCDDFYQFSCGNFIRTNEVPDDYYARNLLQKMQESMFVEMKHNLERQLTNETGNNIKDEPIYIRQIKSLYESCVNDTDDMIGMNDPIESLSELIIELIGSHWPLVPSEESAILPASGSGSNSFEYKLALLFLYQVHPFFQVYVIRDKNTSTYALHIFPGSPVMDQLNFVSPKSLDNLSDDQVNLYMNFQREIVKTFLISKNENDTNDEQRIEIERELLNMIKLEIDLANITKDASFENSNCSMSTSNNGTETYDSELCDDRDVETNHFIRLSFDQMEEEFPRIKWKEFFKFALKDANVSATYVLTQTKEYFHSLMAIMERANDRTLINYMGWSIIAKYMPYMGSQFKHLSSELQQKILIMDGDNEVTNRFKYYQSRWKQCVYIACESLKIPSNVLYLDGHQTNLTNTVEDIIKLIEEMKMIFVQIIDTQSWIESDDIKRILKDRIRSIKSNIGVQEYIKNHTLIESMYESLDVQSDKELITNMFNINKHETILQVKKLNSEAKFDGDILFQPLEANAFYDFSTNSIIMPIGIMRSPLVYHNIPKYLKLSFLGIVIGHEIAHSIDILSRKHMSEKEHSLSNPDFNHLYKAKAKCFSEKYSNFMIDETDQFLNGNQTLEENICDFASFQQTFSIYKLLPVEENLQLPGLGNYTTDQIFFIQYAQLWCEVATKDGHVKSLQDNHSPGKFRANGVIMNSRDFPNVFRCASKTKMNPPHKCDLWSNGF